MLDSPIPHLVLRCQVQAKGNGRWHWLVEFTVHPKNLWLIRRHNTIPLTWPARCSFHRSFWKPQLEIAWEASTFKRAFIPLPACLEKSENTWFILKILHCHFYWVTLKLSYKCCSCSLLKPPMLIWTSSFALWNLPCGQIMHRLSSKDTP